MRRCSSRYLADGKGFNRGQAADLIRVEGPGDFERLERLIVERDYYGRAYLADRLGYRERRIKGDDLESAALVSLLAPRALLELGCGRGDLLFLLRLAGQRSLRGTDISREMRAAAWPAVSGRIDGGDLAAALAGYGRTGRRFDTFVGLDIWEHLAPPRLPAIAAALAALAREDALFFFVIPAFGPDPVFGELFPLEFAENRRALEEDRPFDHLLGDPDDPELPANGHLTWAGGAWWQKLFAGAGLVRQEAAERELHRLFDDITYPARRAFYLFALDSPAARLRGESLAAGLEKRRTRFVPLARLARALAAWEDRSGAAVFDRQALGADLRQCWLRRVGIDPARPAAPGPLPLKALRRLRLRLAHLAWRCARPYIL